MAAKKQMQKKKGKNSMPFVSLLVVNFNGKEILAKCLPSLLKQTYPKGSYEVVVLDNASSDGSVGYLQKNFPSVKIVRSETNLGYAGINIAIPHCKGEFIYFLNNDLELEKDCLSLLMSAISKDPSIGMVTHQGVNYFERQFISGGTWMSRLLYSGHRPPTASKRAKGSLTSIPYMGSGIIRRDIIDAYGYLFDPSYFIYAEDVDLGLRIRLLGKRIAMVEGAYAYHMHAITTQKYSTAQRNTFLLERNLLTTFFKVFSAKTIAKNILPYIIFRALAILKDILSLRPKSAYARLRAILWVLLNLRSILARRKKVQSLRCVSDKALLFTMSEEFLFKKPYII